MPPWVLMIDKNCNGAGVGCQMCRKSAETR